ncbi:MAG: DNA cytosine methyltransferase, partial [Candidatus Thiodiazotropha endolucinida]
MVLKVFDFFSGCGGTSKGFENAGLKPVFALDFDKDAANTFKHNFPKVKFSQSDITKFDDKTLEEVIVQDEGTLFCGCAPCQPFTGQNTNKPDSKKDSRRSLLSRFGDLVLKYLPDYVFVENVPGIQRVVGNSTLSRFKKRLEIAGYYTTVEIVESQQYGVPQRRRRLVLLASKHAPIELPAPTHDPDMGVDYSTVRDWIAHLPPIGAGEIHPAVPHHRAATLSPLNLERIRSTPP